MGKWKIDRIISIATLGTSLIALFLVLKKPAPITRPQPAPVAAANAQSFQEKIQQLGAPNEPGQAPAEVHLTSDEVSAALAQAAGAIPASAAQPGAAGQAASSASQPAAPGPPGAPAISPSSPNAPLGPGEPDIKDYQVNFDGDVARGQFLANVGGKDVYVTVAGHLGAKDGYATFDPTEFKVGDLSIPVSLVNDALQKRLGEQRDRLKLPDSVGGIKVEKGELVLTQK
jgi:hypothetical protein